MTDRRSILTIVLAVTAFALPGCAASEKVKERGDWAAKRTESVAAVRKAYTKQEYMISMRDGTRLFTQIYAPKRTDAKFPMLMMRTPYSCRPYGEDDYCDKLGPDKRFMEDGYIFVYQDVRGTYMSEGTFVNMTPHVSDKESPADIDESSDTFDTIEWLLAHIPNHNGRIGMWGISYPGFYSAAGAIDHHPALVAVSPQAPIADWFFDDFHHHGAFFLPHTFNFIASFGKPRPEPTTQRHEHFDHGTPDGYQFFLDLGPLKNVNEKYFHGEIEFWNQAVQHPNYDEFWQRRNLLPHLRHVSPAVLTVGGWFDAEDLYGALNTYRSIEEKNPNARNGIVMGPWSHGGWARSGGDQLGNISFGAKTSDFYNENIIYPFFRYHLKGEGTLDLPEAYMFETGTNRWRRFDAWPPNGLEPRNIYVGEGFTLSFDAPSVEGVVFDEYVSDPTKPVPFTQTITVRMPREYMTDDQRFAARRPDVLAYQTVELDEDVTLAGPVVADLWVSTSGTASDWVVKLIDVFPPDAEDSSATNDLTAMGGYQMMVRSEAIRGRFRNSYEHPEPFVPNQPTRVRLELQDVLHTFQEGHRIMVQVQSTWFPIVDINPHHYAENVFLADEEDFIKATQRVYRSREYPTRLQVAVLPSMKGESPEVVVTQ